MFPLSFAQQRLWFLNRLDEPSSAYNVPMMVQMRGVLDPSALEAALCDVMERHESLRTVFGEADGEPCQRVLPVDRTGLVLQRLDVGRDQVEAALREVAERPFDLDADLPVRACLARVAADEHVLALVMHHVVCDGWSFAPLMGDFSAAYNARVTGEAPVWEPLPVQYSDYTLWQRDLLGSEDDPESLVSGQLRYWRQALAGLPEELELPYDRVRPPVVGHRGAVVEFPIAPEVHAGLQEIGRQTGATMFMVVQAAVAALLSRLGAGSDIPLGTSVAGRTDEALDGLVGMFVNTQVLRADVSGEPSFRELVERVRESNFAAYAHQDLPFERIVEELNPARSRSRHPLFQVSVELHEDDTTKLELTGLTAALDVLETATAKFDLAWDFVESADGGQGTRLRGHLSYAIDLFDRETAERLRDWLLRLLAAVVAQPTLPLRQVPLVGEEERRTLLGRIRPTHDGLDLGVVERVRDHAASRPAATAVIDDDSATTYAELAGRASRVARTLMDAGVDPGTVVPVLARRGAAVVAGILGINTAGGVYLPLDAAAPRARTRNLVSRVDAAHLLADASNFENARLLAQECDRPVEVLLIDEEADPLDDLVPPRGGPDDLAYVIFTSGSTGLPKGAMVHRRGMVNNLLCEAEAMGVDGPCVVTSTAPLTFDISVWQMFVPLISGGTVRAVNDDYVRDPRALFELVAAENVSVLQVVPSLLQAALDEWDTGTGGLPDLKLRCLAVTGEALPAALCLRWSERYPDIPLVNCYGPTECSDDVTQSVITAGSLPSNSRTPIGRAVRGSRLYVLDDNLAWTPDGIVGELYIGGMVVGRGYLDDPRRTAATFIADPFAEEPGRRMYRTGDFVRYRRDGQLEFLGRRDHQVKIRGQRIELGEIEHAMLAVPGVRGAVVTDVQGPGGQKVLVGYYLGAAEPASVRAELVQVLPDAMVPSLLTAMDSFPLTPNGKLDRKALPEPGFAALSSGRPASTRREKILCTIYEQVLATSAVGLDDDFFDLGGHSLLAVQLIRKINATFGLDMGVCMVFECRKVGEMNDLLDRAFAERGISPEQWGE